MKTKQKIIFASILLGIFICAIDLLMDYFFFHQGPSAGKFSVNLPSYEIYAKILIFGGFAVFGFICSQFISKEKEVKTKLEDSLLFQHQLLDAIPVPIFYKNKEYVYTGCNKSFEEFLGMDKKEIIGKTTYDIAPEKLAAVYHEKDTELMNNPGVQIYEFEVKSKTDGSNRRVVFHKATINDKNGQVAGLAGAILDITDRKKAEDALREREKFLNIIFDAIQDGISVLDKDFNVIRVNKIMREWYAHMLPFEGRKKCYEVYHGRSGPCEVCPSIQTFKSGKLEREEVPFVKAEGETGILELFTYPIFDDSGEVSGVVEYVRDITQQRKAQKSLEEETLKVQKLETIGILAGGIAHDFNNILMAIVGNISLAKMQVGTDSKINNILTSAEKAAIRAGDLSQQLLTFSKGGKPIRKPTKLDELIHESASFALTGSNVSCDLRIEDGLWPVNVDEGQISQVIQNIVKNADQSMPYGGVATIHAENKTIRDHELLPLKEGKYIWIMIQDQGPGIPEEHLARIFDPYFSTKTGGSGLGLAVSFSIIKKHDGFIFAESEPGDGATFHIYLPASEERSLAGKKPEKERSLQSGKKILVMDDDQAVLEIVSQMLDIMGLKVETANSGKEAVALYGKAQSEGRPYDAVILDLTVPGGMGGKETLKQLIDIDPEVKALVSSGYSNDPVMADFQRHCFSGVIAKPYNMEKLGRALCDLFS